MRLCAWNSSLSPKKSLYSLDTEYVHLRIVSIFVLDVRELRPICVTHVYSVNRASLWAFGAMQPSIPLLLLLSHFSRVQLCATP